MLTLVLSNYSVVVLIVGCFGVINFVLFAIMYVFMIIN